MTQAVQWTGDPDDKAAIIDLIGNHRVVLCTITSSGALSITFKHSGIRIEVGQWVVIQGGGIKLSDENPLADPRQHIADWLAEHGDGGRACAALRAVLNATEPIDGDDAYEFGYASAMSDVVTAAHEALRGEGE